MRIFIQVLWLPVIVILAACSDQSANTSTTIGSEQADPVVNPANALADETAALRMRLDSLRARAQRIRDSNDIKRLQRTYGYYVDEALWDELVALLSDDATIEYARDGVYRGKARIREYLDRLNGGQQGLKTGQLNEHFQLMPVITLADDGLSAKGRWRGLILAGQSGEVGAWGEGPYENEYVKEDGVWKISKVRWYQTIMVPYEGVWGKNADLNQGIYVSPEFPPDAPPTADYGSWPETFLPPFHFDNPIGRYVPAASNPAGAQQ